MKFEETRVMNFEGALRGMRNALASWSKADSFFHIWADGMDEEWKAETIHQITEKYLENLVEGDYDEAYHKQSDYLYDMSTRCTQWGEHAMENNIIGPNDMGLALRLIHAGDPSHRKFLRQIMVSVDITAPLYWWKEFDTYKVGTTANSTSTMHKLASTPITLDCFETDDYDDMVDVFNNPSPMEYPLHDFISCAGGLLDMLESLRQKYNETKDRRYWKELVRWLPNGWLQTRTVTMNYENLRSMYHQRKHHKLTEWHSFCEWVETLPYAQEFIVD